MTRHTDLFTIYRDFDERAVAAVRAETYGQDIGQNSWTTVDEAERFLAWLRLGPGQRALEVASGSGGPACFLAERTGCRVLGIDANEHGVATATRLALERGLTSRVEFQRADANAALPFADAAFDALSCVDSMNHLTDRLGVLREWARVLRPGGRAVFTDPVVVTGPVTNEELAMRSSIGVFLFVPPGLNESLIEKAGLRLVREEDVTANAAMVAGRWHRARAAHGEELVRIEGVERFEGLQRFLQMVERLTHERRLSRIAYYVERPASG